MTSPHANCGVALLRSYCSKAALLQLGPKEAA
jgi:hypothetical protein